MCCCEKPNVNGQAGYKWNFDDNARIRPVDPPDADGAEIIFDEPGRCGGIDSHSYHFRLIKEHGAISLLVRHGAGDEKIEYISNSRAFVSALNNLDSDGRYWVMLAMFHAQKDAARNAKAIESVNWSRAAAEKRIKTRKMRKNGHVKVWIEN